VTQVKRPVVDRKMYEIWNQLVESFSSAEEKPAEAAKSGSEV